MSAGLWVAGLVLALWGWLLWRGRRWPDCEGGPEEYRRRTRGGGNWAA